MIVQFSVAYKGQFLFRTDEIRHEAKHAKQVQDHLVVKFTKLQGFTVTRDEWSEDRESRDVTE